ncbi:MAG: PAS domain S-box protein [Candidatus Zixiibacteriota bacterium]
MNDFLEYLKNLGIPKDKAESIADYADENFLPKQHSENSIDNNKNYKEIVENVFDVFCRYSPDGKIKYISPQIEQYGYKADELIGHDFTEFIHPDDIQSVLADFQNTIKNKITFPTTFRFREKQGSYVYIEEMSDIKIRDGKVIEFIAILRDVTERHLSEEALREAEGKYRSMFEHIIDVYFRTDKNGNLTLVSPSGTRLFNYETTFEMLGKNITKDFFYNEFTHKDLIELVKEKNRLVNSEVILKTKDGNEVFAEVNAQAIYDNINNFVGMEGMIRDISERKLAVEKMHDSEQRFQELVNLLPQIVFEMDTHGNLIFVNKTAIDKTGYNKDEIMNLNFYDFLAESEKERVHNNFHKALRGEVIEDNEYIAKKKDGTEYPVLIYSTPIYKNGNTKGLIGIFIDISIRKKVEEKYRESEKNYRELTELLPQTIFELDKDGYFSFLNEKGFDLTGVSYEKFRNGLHVTEVIYDKEHDLLKKRIKKILSGTTVGPQQYHIKHSDGCLIPVMISSSPINRNGEYVGIRGIVVDITEQIAQAEKLRTSRQRLQLALEGANEGLWDWNIDTGEAYLSDIWCQMLGYEPEELPNHYHTWEKLLHPDDKERVIETLEAHLRGETEKYQTEYRMLTASGEWRWILSQGRAVERDENGDPLRAIGTQIDLTEKKRIQEKFKQVEKMESLVRLAGGVAQNLNDILFGMISYPDLILLKLNEDSSLRKYVEKIKDSSAKARRMIQDLLALSEQEKPEKKTIRTNDLIYDFSHSVEFANIKNEHKNINFKIRPGKNIPKIEVSESHLFKCIRNLVKFAADSMPFGGDVYLSTLYRKFENQLSLSWQIDPGEYVVINIRDTSGGIKKENTEKIFEPFFTSNALNHDGTGLELAIVWSIIKGHNGEIKVESHEGEGTEFSVYLPAII